MNVEHKRAGLLIAGLVGFSSLVQVFIISRAVSTEYDTLRFVATARSIAEQGLIPTLRAGSEQPLFPMAVWLVHELAERTAGESRWLWVLSAQVAAAIPLVLAIVPIYLLSVRLVGQAAGLAGALLFCVLPEASRLGGDGISDSTHLLFLCAALWAVAVYLMGTDQNGEPCTPTSQHPPYHPRSPLWLLLAGLSVGIATLARMEVLVLPAAVVLLLVLLQMTERYGQPWLKITAAIGCLAVGMGLVLGPYLLVAEATAPRAAVARILGHGQPKPAIQPSPSVPPTELQLADGQPMSFAHKDPSIQTRRRGLGAVAELCGQELADAFGYWIGPFALLGLWQLRRTLVRPVDWFDFLFIILYGLAAAWFASREGYLSSRHLLAIVVLGIGCGGYGLLATGRWIGVRLFGTGGGDSRLARLLCPALPWLAVATAGAACLVESSTPLNHTYQYHRQAAEWIARQADVPGEVLDTFGLTSLYSGRPTWPYRDAPAVLGRPDLAYVVVENRELEFPTRRGQTLRTLLEAAAEPVVRFAEPATEPSERTVVVYRWRPERFTEWRATGP